MKFSVYGGEKIYLCISILEFKDDDFIGDVEKPSRFMYFYIRI